MFQVNVNPGTDKPFLTLWMIHGGNQFSCYWETTPAELRRLANELERIEFDRKTQQFETYLNEVESHYTEIGGEA